MPEPRDAADALTEIHRAEWGRIVAGLARRFGDLDLAEEVAADAFAVAVERWAADGVPPNPGAWITTTAHRRAMDRLRREARRDDKHREALLIADDSPAEEVGAVADDRLRLLFACCHPLLGVETRVALTLRVVAGLSVEEIARLFLVPPTTIAQRITRGKAKIGAARIPFRVPEAGDLPERAAAVVAVLSLMYTHGYAATGEAPDRLRIDLLTEAVRLAREPHVLLPDDGDVTGLLALLLASSAQIPARLAPDGALVTLSEQNRDAWDRAMISEADALIAERQRIAQATGIRLGRFELLAAVHLVHARAPDARSTDWSQIVTLYEMLERVDPSPIVGVNHAIAVAEADSPEAGLAVLERHDDTLAGHYAFHAVRAHLRAAGGETAEALRAYDRAISLAPSPEMAELLAARRRHLAHNSSH
ncbi:RNA polymerase sigma factor [Microbacterium kunmingense]|uniref:RNA polymerase sigma factor n=1 Tax=Microbacterium kunmingense TaxID=2915939 RepID=UPI003D710724